MNIVTLLYGGASSVYLTLAFVIVFQSRQTSNMILALCCAVTAIWAAVGAVSGPDLLEGSTGFLDLLRTVAWYFYLLHFYTRSGTSSKVQVRTFAFVGIACLLLGIFLSLAFSRSQVGYTIYSAPIVLRMVLSVFELLLIENLYFNFPQGSRWHIALPCIMLASLTCFDILVIADTALFSRPSLGLEIGRVVSLVTVAPLLVLAAQRGQRWREAISLSRAAAFHSAALVLSGSVLLSLALVGEVLRNFDQSWGLVAELSLVFLGLTGVMLFATSRTAKSILDQVITHHFFADRYDYRHQWLTCIETLSGGNNYEGDDLNSRTIKAVADIVNSPSGMLFILDDKTSGNWACSWNMPPGTEIPAGHPLIKVAVQASEVIDLTQPNSRNLTIQPFTQNTLLWLAVPLRHMNDVVGIVVVGPPRAPFKIDQEVYDLLKIIGREIGTYITERRAAEAVARTQSLHDYGKRFAFVAHDIKNVSSQLALLLANAERHIGNPAFQQDMLGTVRASVQKIDRLIGRLNKPISGETLSIDVVSRLVRLVDSYRIGGRVDIQLKVDGCSPRIAGAEEAFDTSISHLLNNAIEASTNLPVLVAVTQQPNEAIIEIVDSGQGMTPEFIRSELFLPFRSTKKGGSGIGAFQARELINDAGGTISVHSHVGIGTTMRIVFPTIPLSEPVTSTDLPLGMENSVG